MVRKAHGQIRQGQVITTWGPGALLDLPRSAGIVGGLDTWPAPERLQEILEQRLISKIQMMTGVSTPRLFAPPAAPNDPREPNIGIGVWRFPEWFVVREYGSKDLNDRSRRLVHRKALDERGRFDERPVVPTRFVRACPNGHVDDLNWRYFVHWPDDNCKRQLWLDERGTSGDLADLKVRCECGKSRPLYEATHLEDNPLGTCSGARPWLGRDGHEDCNLPSRLLIRTAANAYFPQVVSVLSIPNKISKVESIVRELWDDLQIVDDVAVLAILKRKTNIAAKLDGFNDEDVLGAILSIRNGSDDDKPVKHVELDALLAAPEGFCEDVPIDPNFHARRLPDSAWRHSGNGDSKGIKAIIQLHRLREVLALTGFTRFEAITPDIHGEYDTDVKRAGLALEPTWFPAVENRGEGLFVLLDETRVKNWMKKKAVEDRLEELASGHAHWCESRKSERPFPGGPYILLHTLSHLLIQSLAMRCGYPASSLRERIYSNIEGGRFGILLFTGSPDAEGTLGGLVQQGRHIEEHLAYSLRLGSLCSNDPICAQHVPGESIESRLLHGAACHGCTLVAETCCEMRNDYLDRALVVPTVANDGTAYFGR